MEFRKLIAFGKGSYIVSIPKTWTERNNLKKGDMLSLEETSTGLLISNSAAEAIKEKKSVTIPIDGKDLSYITAEIISAYLSNADSIEILAKDLQKNAVPIKNTLINLAGMEILEQTSTKMVAKYLLDKREISIPLIIRRMDNITRAMIEDVIKCVDGCHSVENIIQRDTDVNRLHFLAFREIRAAILDPRIAKSIEMNQLDLHTTKHIVMRIERIADCQKAIATNLETVSLNDSSKKELKEIFILIKHLYFDAMKAYYTKDLKIAFQIELSIQRLLDTCDKFLLDHVHAKPDPKDKHNHVST
ncbi:MAG: phosphate uptake regulator PhoU, partial [Nanoarchaeota archaeon]|nr:phosphate uptake regulator PhoU [Nanoarchaeota archaeon]